VLKQVGTEQNPFPANFTATITLYGHLRSKELPIYGTKMIALREGTLDLHGRPTPVTWTTLESTALAGQKVVTLTHPVNWLVSMATLIHKSDLLCPSFRSSRLRLMT
jgi:hypothetical protein